MINIVNHKFLDRKGNSVILINSGEQEETNMAYILSFLLNNYQPNQSLVLSIGEIRSLNGAIDLLEENIYDEGVVIEMEDEHFFILKKVILDLLPKINIPAILRNAPQISDFLDEITPQSGFKKSHLG